MVHLSTSCQWGWKSHPGYSPPWHNSSRVADLTHLGMVVCYQGAVSLWYQWIRLKKILPENPIFIGKSMVFGADCPLNPSTEWCHGHLKHVATNHPPLSKWPFPSPNGTLPGCKVPAKHLYKNPWKIALRGHKSPYKNPWFLRRFGISGDIGGINEHVNMW